SPHRRDWQMATANGPTTCARCWANARRYGSLFIIAEMAVTSASFSARAPLGRGVEVIASDPAGLIALAKPAGTLSHPNHSGEESRALLNASYALDGECYRWTDPTGIETTAWLL